MSALAKLRDYQTKTIKAIHEQWDAGVWRPASVLATGAGKGHPLWTMVPTPNGLRRWGDLKTGDLVFGSDGRPTAVTDVFDRGELPTYLVTLSDGSSVTVDGEHLWNVRDYRHRTTRREFRMLSTQTLLSEGLKLDRGYRFRIPMARPVMMPHVSELPLHPYVVGALIANGGLAHDGTMLTTPDPHVSGRVSCWTTVNRVADTTPGVCPRFSLPGLTRATRNLGMRVKSGEKRIPAIYLNTSVQQRIDLLHGLMDGDGSMRDTSRRSVQYSTTSPGLADDVRQLVSSLGGSANVRSAQREGKAAEHTIGIMMPENIPAFSTPAKLGSGNTAERRRVPVRSIVSIEPARPEFIRCITVAAADSLYLITRNHIVTHNTVVFSHLADEYLRANPGKRVLILSHTDELVNQAAHKMSMVNPERTIGIVKAERNEVHAEIISASVQSLRSAARRNKLRNVGLIVVDECHHATARTYQTILQHFGALNADGDPVACGTACRPGWHGHPITAGFTATLVRGDKSKLSDVWQDVAIRVSIAFLIRAGYLLDVKGKRVEVPDLNLKEVKQSGGDYQEGALGEALVDAMAPEIVAKAYTEHAIDRKGLIFAPTVASAYAFAEAFSAQGITTEVVHGALARDERRAILARLKSGETRVVSNCMVLTEGFDEPTVSCAVVARPTKSSGLYQQMVGRVLRPDLSLKPADRGHALILDVVGVSRMHGLQSLVDLSTRDDLDREDLSEDLSLLEMEDLIFEDEQEEPGGDGSDAPAWYVGPADTKDFDPLGADSKRTWGKTPEGTYWLSAGTDGYVFLADSIEGEPGTYDVVWCAKTVGRGQRFPTAAMTEHRGLTFEMALAWAEEEATERGGHGTATLTTKKSRWRKDPATAPALKLAQRFGHFRDAVWVQEGGPELNPLAPPEAYPVRPMTPDGELITKGEVAEAIDAGTAAKVIDPLVTFVKKRAHR